VAIANPGIVKGFAKPAGQLDEVTNRMRPIPLRHPLMIFSFCLSCSALPGESGAIDVVSSLNSPWISLTFVENHGSLLPPMARRRRTPVVSMLSSRAFCRMAAR
jgi:hypothetical protein